MNVTARKGRYDYRYTNVLKSEQKKFSFDIHKNGIYTVKLENPSRNFTATVSLTDGEVTKTLTVPTELTYDNRWILYEIEVYQGDITIHTINKLNRIYL